jgi:malonate decarboxylase gamma subunit
MPEYMTLCDTLFPQGHDVAAEGEMLHGSGTTAQGPVAVIGTHQHAAIGVDLAFALATEVLRIVERFPKRPILMLVDTQGQQLSRRDELLGNGGYLAHLSKCFEIARLQGHLLLSLVYGEAVSGGYLSLGMIADRAYALADAQIRVMALPAMARITQIPIEDLQELCRTSAIFGPGVANYRRLGAVEAVWAQDMASSLAEALRAPADGDRRAALGAERGGRVQAQRVIDAVLAAP